MTSDPHPPQLTTVIIAELHGNRDVILTLKDNKRILIDENGTGKTTVLSMLFHLLSQKTERLQRFSFSRIALVFTNGESIEFARDELLTPHESEDHGYLTHAMSSILKHTNEKELSQLLSATTKTYQSFYKDPISIKAANASGFPRRIVYDSIRMLLSEQGKFGKTKETHSKLQQLSRLLPHKVLYFPTYRRIEEDLQSLGRPGQEIEKSEELIQFGMGDVKNKLDSITAEIRAKSVEWYSIVNGRMISQLTDGIHVTPKMRETVNNTPTLRIVLDRIGTNITNEKKADILKIVSSPQISDRKYEPLIYFLANLMQIYENQKVRDNDIKEFTRITNGYLRNKEIRYDESKLSITVTHKETGQEVQLNNLSSGEKQIVSTFSKVYFSESSRVTILFDEPELSLSMEWQRRFLQDIAESNRCAVLIAATHSPFIFENSLDTYADQLKIRTRTTHVPR
ncbi:ATP-binding protein [Myxococcus sp. CA056]|uniref:AAA family ATPase n=1 Tax=Myxococcus sp. CA056 TaxID=2741740 RepID=UPI00157AE9B4|nr:AAA family ATPase [Myxococcus sp. CA056]NTX15481.1 ATP-binding protein [Myxococcus sp. CA056]